MKLAERIGVWLLRLLAREGSLTLTHPDGRETTIGREGRLSADLTINDYSAVAEIARLGLNGFAESYMSGTVDTSDLRRLVDWGLANQRGWFDHPIARWSLPARRLAQTIMPERRHRKVQSMGDHYNLGNDFYEKWLDETMTYSSARFSSPDQELADAQMNKYKIIADSAGLRPGMRVLDIGCGWGGFAEYAGRERGCEVVGITLSEEQAEYARKRIADAGLTDRVEISIRDFRDVEGQFDAIASIEMIESVDETNWDDLFMTISRCLGPSARAAMQVITIADTEWETYRSRADFIQQYIFPGGELPAPKILSALADRAGLIAEKVETFGLDYARTLDAWHARFDSGWDAIEVEHELDERFRRMWDLYLILCSAGFRSGRVNVEEWVFARGDGVTH